MDKTKWPELNFQPLLKLIVSLILIVSGGDAVSAYNMRQTSNADGLSNSAILSMCRDNNGFLWAGTCDGVNIADGSGIYPFRELFPGQSLSGNIIETIHNGGKTGIWVLTNYGLDLVDVSSRSVTTFPQFKGQERLCSDEQGRLFVVSEESDLYLYSPDAENATFVKLGHLNHNFTDVRRTLAAGNRFWVATEKGIYRYDIDIAPQAAGSRTLVPESVNPELASQFAKTHGNSMLIVKSDGQLGTFDTNEVYTPVADISGEIAKRGKISDITADRSGNYFVSFRTDGVVRLHTANGQSPEIEDLGLNVGIFCLESSDCQDVVWIGSDCRGIYTYWDDNFGIRSYDFNEFNRNISHPVRTIFIDSRKNMWLGTKGDGVLHIDNIDELNPLPDLGRGRLFTSANSELCHNSVFGFCESSRPILWIATEEGVNYYSYTDGRIHRVDINPAIRYIHGIVEADDSTLWLCTLGQGVARARITGSPQNPELTDITIFKTDDGRIASNQFFAMTRDEQDGSMLFCNRGQGMFRIVNNRLSQIPMKTDFGNNAVTDVFDAVKTGDIMWVGTGHGLLKMSAEGETLYSGIENGFVNNTIHKMIDTGDGSIWISTNKGIVRFDSDGGTSQTYGQNYGLNVTEYSDGAGFFTGNTLIFGGINGLTFINDQQSYSGAAPYAPPLKVLKLSIAGSNVPLTDYLRLGSGDNRIVLKPNQNHFAITFSAPDFINAHSYTFVYTLDGVSWINNGMSPTISFNEMSHGTYNLSVKYINRASGIESEPYTLQIVVDAPWYLSSGARILYALLLVAAISAGVYLYLRRQRQKQQANLERLEQAHREEIYEEKLKFFTNITHEFCTPLTLIYGPCERILSYNGSDDYIRRYVGLIRTNAERLNTLIQELIDFRRIETGHKRLKPAMVEVSTVCSEIAASFAELSERNNINLINEIAPAIEWPSDYSCIRKIVTNLISNAFKYTATGGTIKIKVDVSDNRLTIRVFNTGKGISDDDKAKIFNRYSILDNVEENAIKGLSRRNGLGMAICHSMVDMLGGSIDIESVVGEFAEFIVSIPALEIAANAGPAEPSAHMAPEPALPTTATVSADTPEPAASPAGNRTPANSEKILVVDDNRAILSLLSDCLSDYDVVTAETADRAIEIIGQSTPDMIISDVMMPGIDGFTFTQIIKGNKHTMHIPFVLLSAKTSNEEKITGIEAGADAYISKPFSIDYLRAVVRRLLENRSHLREYYNTSASAYEFNEGKLLKREDKDFMATVIEFIDSKIDDPDLSPEMLATHMKISARNLYRKFKDLDQLSPNDFIKYQRISFAAKLLLTTSSTVQEIIYRSGFTNRSHFYKEFDKRFGMTPKDYRTANETKDPSLSGS